MNQHIDNTRRQLGELAGLAAQVEAAERKILAQAEAMLAKVEQGLDAARAAAMSGDDATKDRYLGMVEERGRLQQVIAQARAVLTD